MSTDPLMKPRIEVERGLGSVRAENFAETDIVLHAVIPALDNAHRGSACAGRLCVRLHLLSAANQPDL